VERETDHECRRLAGRRHQPRPTMTDLFRRGEVQPEGRTNEEELELLAASPVVSVVPAS
jgi:hypothetical protein